MASSIGIKIANGEFYPVLEEGSTVKKRLVLTTVHDGQRSVQIDLYRSDSRSMADASYIGSLVVENIVEKPKGEPSIELVIGSDGADELVAEAVDLDAGAGGRQQLNVLLHSMEDGETYEVPDFELETESPSAPPPGLYARDAAADARPARADFPLIPVVLIALVVLIGAGAMLWYFVFSGLPAAPAEKPAASAVEKPVPAPPPAPKPAPEPAKAAPAAPKPVAVEPVRVEPPKPAAPAPVSKSEAAARRTRPVAPVKTYKVPKTIPKAGFRYRVRWGDTLWDISEAFYRNPWLYPRIARFNNIRNPDLIISGSFIKVPPKK